MKSAETPTRAVILAAGRGTRLGQLTAELPKVMIELDGHTLLAHQRRSLAAAGITDVHLVLGHGAEAVKRHPDAQGLTFWHNPDYETTNMVASLLCAGDLLDGTSDLIIAYGDIVYEPRLLQALMNLDVPLGVVIDLAWRSYWEARMPDPLADAETLRMDKEGHILELGSRPGSYSDIEGQYTGLIRVSAQAAPALRARAGLLVKSDANSFMTALLQDAIDDGVRVQSAKVRNGWLEMDTAADLRLDYGRFFAAVAESSTGSRGLN